MRMKPSVKLSRKKESDRERKKNNRKRMKEENTGWIDRQTGRKTDREIGR